MTITALSYIYGVAVPKTTFLKWSVASHSIWFQRYEKQASASNLIDFAKWMEANPDSEVPDEFADSMINFISTVTENMHDPNLQDCHNDLHLIGAYEVPHDQCAKLIGDGEEDGTEYVIIGQRRAFIHVLIDKTVDLETQMPLFTLPEGYDYSQTILEETISNEMSDLIKIADCTYHLVQNDCACCS